MVYNPLLLGVGDTVDLAWPCGGAKQKALQNLESLICVVFNINTGISEEDWQSKLLCQNFLSL